MQFRLFNCEDIRQVKKFAMFADYNDSDLNHLLEGSIVATFNHEDTILTEGEPVNSLGILLSGKVVSAIKGSSFNIQLGSGDVIGEEAFGGADSYLMSVKVIEQAEVIWIRLRNLNKLFQIYPLLGLKLFGSLNKQLVIKRISAYTQIHSDSTFTHYQRLLHDIRSPIAALKVLASDLRITREHDRKLLELIIARLEKITNPLNTEQPVQLALQPKSSRVQDTVEIHQIRTMIEKLIIEKQIQYSNHSGIKCRYFEAHSLVQYNSAKLKITETKFVNMLSNLIDNSYQSLKRGGAVEVSLSTTNNELVLTIQDNGKGIAQRILSKIGKMMITSKKNGRGFGLYYAYKEVQQWGGRIEIQSQLKKGTSVSVFLPYTEIRETVGLVGMSNLTHLQQSSQ
jgi:signal transduction histidine kinase